MPAKVGMNRGQKGWSDLGTWKVLVTLTRASAEEWRRQKPDSGRGKEGAS